ncbi:hypothetical protein QP917_05475 [Corynebacterium pseudodiphtheriticum]|nr:hypothetical protein [Corynebacterium pseudodiphtheriticum]
MGLSRRGLEHHQTTRGAHHAHYQAASGTCRLVPAPGGNRPHHQTTRGTKPHPVPEPGRNRTVTPR